MIRTALLGNLIEDIAMGPFGSNLKKDNFIGSGVPVVRGGNLYGEKVGGGFVFVSEEKAQTLRRSLARPDDIVITHRGTLGQVSIVPDGEYPYYLVSQSQLRLTPNKELVHPRYLLYYLRSPVGQHELMQHAAQVGVPSIATPTKAVKSFRVILPSLADQQRVVDILSTLDGKIELNRRMNETLEQIGQALFRQYFIDNVEVDKWVVHPLSSQFEILSGGTPRTSEPSYWNGDIPWFSVVDVPSDSDLFTVHTAKSITREGLENSAAKLIPKYTTIISARGTVGKLAIACREMTINQSCYALKSDTPFYSYLLVKDAIGRIKASAHGSVFDTVTRDTFDRLKCVAPPKELVGKFEGKAEPIFMQILHNAKEAVALTGLRDILLPRLISGKVKM